MIEAGVISAFLTVGIVFSTIALLAGLEEILRPKTNHIQDGHYDAIRNVVHGRASLRFSLVLGLITSLVGLWFFASSENASVDTYLVLSMEHDGVDLLPLKVHEPINLNEKEKKKFAPETMFKVTEYGSALGLDWNSYVQYNVYEEESLELYQGKFEEE